MMIIQGKVFAASGFWILEYQLVLATVTIIFMQTIGATTNLCTLAFMP